jgi:hypothetical protein
VETTKKDDVCENCCECNNEMGSIDICEENGNFVIDGEVIKNEIGAILADLIGTVEANEAYDPDMEGITCKRK